MAGGMVGGASVVNGIVCTVDDVDDGWGGWVVTVVVVSSGSVVGVVVAGEVVAGALVPTLRGAVVTTAGWVVTEPPDDGMVATVVVLEPTVDEVEVDGATDVVVAPVVEVGRAVVVGDWVATCSLGEVSAPVATSTSMAASAMAART